MKGKGWLLVITLLLTGCVAPQSQYVAPQKSWVEVKGENFDRLVKLCVQKYPLDLKSVKNKKQALNQLLELNDCKRSATLEAMPELGTDLINLAYAKRAAIFSNLGSGKISSYEMQAQLSQVDVDFTNAVTERIKQNTPPPRSYPTMTSCSRSSAGGVDCFNF